MSNHLWQSTVFVILAGFLTLAFRRNRAQVRYWLWLVASTKFLLPFSLLLTLGGYFARPTTSHHTAVPAVVVSAEEFAEPFAPNPTPPSPVSLPPLTGHKYWVPSAAIGLWVLGLVGVLLIRWRGWRRIRVAVRASTPAGIPFPVEVRSSPAVLEPGVVGFLRPILVLPAGLVERFAPDQLQAVLRHELCHIRRHDNLTALIHMLVEALFWFHPLVWWIGARLVEEREHACDEAALESVSDREAYAECILKTCQFCVESPLACVSGVASANLKKRIVRIMTQRAVHPVSLSQKLLLCVVSLAVVACPLLLGIINVPPARAQSGPLSPALPPFTRMALSQETAPRISPALYGAVFVTPIPNAPFSAVVVQNITQISGDGSSFEYKTSGIIARDSQGRIHNETHEVVPAASTVDPALIRIHLYDPNTRANLLLYPYSHVAQHRILGYPPSAVPPDNWAQHEAAGIHLPDDIREEYLGSDIAQGFVIHGYRRTTAISEKLSGTGNEVDVVNEYWYSEELRLDLIIRHSDPRVGSFVLAVENLNVGEPPADLFEVPAEYKMVDETRP